MFKIGVKGKILKGDDTGHFIWIQDDAENTGGYLILTASDPEFQDGYDNWVQDTKALEQFFIESNWAVEWLE